MTNDLALGKHSATPGDSSSSASEGSLGTYPGGVPPFLPDDINVNNLVPAWNLRVEHRGEHAS